MFADLDQNNHGQGLGGGRRFWSSHAVQIALMAGLLLVAAWTGERWLDLPHRVAVALYLASGVFGGWDLVEDLIRDLRRGRFKFDVHLLMLLAASALAPSPAAPEAASSISRCTSNLKRPRRRSRIRSSTRSHPPKTPLAR